MAYTNQKGVKKRTTTRNESGTNSGLTQSLSNPNYVHALPTPLLIKAHNRIELEHEQKPKDRTLHKIHTHLFYEMQLRGIDHFDSDPNLFEPKESVIWPFSEPLSDQELDTHFSNFIKNNKKL